jgi:hypothetical protein
MMYTKKLAEAVKRGAWVIRAQTEGLTHEQTVIKPPFRGNCMNWVLGHIADNRDNVLSALGQPRVMSEEDAALYRRGSEPVSEGEDVVSLPDLMAILQTQEESLASSLVEAPADLLEQVVDEERGWMLIDRIEFLLWHETYHIGQLEYLRQLAGTDDSVID